MTLAEPSRTRVRERLLRDQGDDDIAAKVERLVREEAPLLGGTGRAAAVRQIVDEVAGLGPLEPLLADPAVTEVMVNGPGPVWIERNGTVEETAVHLDGP